MPLLPANQLLLVDVATGTTIPVAELPPANVPAVVAWR
jgi:hypothetical protein